jgi:hypothetical protein
MKKQKTPFIPPVPPSSDITISDESKLHAMASTELLNTLKRGVVKKEEEESHKVKKRELLKAFVGESLFELVAHINQLRDRLSVLERSDAARIKLRVDAMVKERMSKIKTQNKIQARLDAIQAEKDTAEQLKQLLETMEHPINEESQDAKEINEIQVVEKEIDEDTHRRINEALY